jgi:hypothetical protein
MIVRPMAHSEFEQKLNICHPHNVNEDLTTQRPFGIRVTLRAGDTFTRLLGPDWEQTHWYATAVERDRALEDMAGEHIYSRRGDRPSHRYERVELDSHEGP